MTKRIICVLLFGFLIFLSGCNNKATSAMTEAVQRKTIIIDAGHDGLN